MKAEKYTSFSRQGMVNTMYDHLSNFTFILYEALGKNENISLQVPYVSAEPGDCGIGCVAMMLQSRGIKTPDVDHLSEKYKKEGYYIHDIGWSHNGLVTILQESGVAARRAERQIIFQIVDSLQKDKPVMVSLRVPDVHNLSDKGFYKPQNEHVSNTGHLCLVVGIRKDTVVLHDPRNIGKYSAYLHVPFRDFKRIITGRCIYLL